MDKVYDTIYNNDQTEEINFVDMGSQNVFDQISEFSKFSILMCDGHIASNGWKQLENYPNDFKVIEKQPSMDIHFTFLFWFSVRFDYLRLCNGWLSHRICE